MTPLLGNSPAWRTAEPSKLAGDEGELVPSYPNPVTLLLCTVLKAQILLKIAESFANFAKKI